MYEFDICKFYRLTSGNRPKFSDAMDYIADSMTFMTEQQLEDSYYALREATEVYILYNRVGRY